MEIHLCRGQAAQGAGAFRARWLGPHCGHHQSAAASKYCYWVNEKLPDDPDGWLSGAEQHPGSWWIDWARWVARRAGEKVAGRVPGRGRLKVIEDAPGSYVKVRIDRH